MSKTTLVVHGHFYQPPRENPWTEEVGVEPSAAPFHDWNERITVESYRPNGWARVVDDRGRVAQIVNNYRHFSFDVGPTLASWLEAHHPDVYERIVEGDRFGGGAMAQAYNHLILPLANDRDARTQVRWGLADFEHRFGRPAEGMWLPETAVDDRILAILAEEGVRFTILAPNQAQRVRPLDETSAPWVEVDEGRLDTRRTYRWLHPAGDGSGVDVVFYDGPLSHDLAFALSGLSSEAMVRRVQASAPNGGVVALAADGESFGHHHKFTERMIAYVFAKEAATAGVEVATAAGLLRSSPPSHEVQVRLSSWSCQHGVGRWKEDCGCRTGGEPHWNQRWRAPLRAALDVLRDAGAEVFERRGTALFVDPWAARDAYIGVILGQETAGEFTSRWLVPGADYVEALTLLEAQRQSLLMYTSCGWFFNDLAGIETVQVLRYAARCIDLLHELGERPPVAQFLNRLSEAESNDPVEGSGRDLWGRRVETARVDVNRVVAHIGLTHLLERQESGPMVGGYEVLSHLHERRERGGIEGSAGRVVLVHRRTRRRTTHVYAALHFGGLEVFGATRAARLGVDDDDEVLSAFVDAVESGERVSTLLRVIAEGFGPHEFGLESALPDAADQIVRSLADGLVERFAAIYERLHTDHRASFDALAQAGFRLPAELRMPIELALARRFEQQIAKGAEGGEAAAYRAAGDLVREARAGGFKLATPRAAEILGRSLLTAVERAVVRSDDAEQAAAAVRLLDLIRELRVPVDVSRPQELVHEALVDRAANPAMLRLAAALGLAPQSAPGEDGTDTDADTDASGARLDAAAGQPQAI